MEFSPEQVDEFKQAFNLFSAEKSTISKQSLTEVMKKNGMKPTSDDIDKMMEELSDNGGSDFNSFLSMISDKLNTVDNEAKKLLIKMFGSFDPADSGFISHDDLKGVLSFSGNSKFSDKEIKELIKLADAGEGRIDYLKLVDSFSVQL